MIDWEAFGGILGGIWGHLGWHLEASLEASGGNFEGTLRELLRLGHLVASVGIRSTLTDET